MEFLTARGPQALFEKSLKFHKTQNEYGWGRTTRFVKILNGTVVLVYVALKFGSDFRSRIRPVRVAGNRPVRDGFGSKGVIVEVLISGLTFLGPTNLETDLGDFGTPPGRPSGRPDPVGRRTTTKTTIDENDHEVDQDDDDEDDEDDDDNQDDDR